MKSRFVFVLIIFYLSANFAFAKQVLTLNDALDIAMKNSPDIQRSKLSLERSKQSLLAQQASLKSQFSLSITPIDYSNIRQFNNFFNTWNNNETKSSSGNFSIRQPVKWTDGTLSLNNRLQWQDSYSEYNQDRSKTFNNNLYLSYTQPLFTYNKTKLDLKELELDFENTALSYALQKLGQEYQVTRDFYTVYNSKMSYQIAIEEYNNQDASYQIIKNKVDAGLSAREELYQAELNLATSKSKMQNAKVTLENALDSFKKLSGISLMEEIDVIADVTLQPATVRLDQALESGLKARMELRQRNIDIENSIASLTRTKSLNEFKGDLTLTYGIIGTDEKFEDMYNESTKNQRLALTFDVPLFDWGERKARIKAAEASLQTQQLALNTQKDDIIIGIRQAVRELENLEIQIEIERQNVKNAELTYEIKLEQYRNGDLTSMDLNLYQTQLSDSKIGLVNASINYKLALLNLKIESMWDFVENKQVLPELNN